MPHALQRHASAEPERLTALERQLAEREQALAERKRELQHLQERYFRAVGGLYDRLTELQAAVAAEEVRAGLRLPPADEDVLDEPSERDSVDMRSCGSRPAAPSAELKKVFRDLAKTLHPDLALDEPARCRRHSLMAEANRAYAERDEDRLRLILRVWERAPESLADDGPDADRLRTERLAAEIETRLLAIERELVDLERSAIGRLAAKIADARAQGWDLFAEMILQVSREVARASARLASLRAGATA
jgi:hypothetical protein